MKLIELTATDPGFKRIRFNPEGLTLIIGDGAKDPRDEGSSNGVGKTLALGLIHHCLGANLNTKLKEEIPEWSFRLRFSVQGQEHLVERSADGKKLFLDSKPQKLTHYREWLNECGVFRPDQNLPGITFRALFKRFARFLREDCVDPLKTHKEPEFYAQLHSTYLLGLDCTLAVNKHAHKKRLDELRRWTKRNLQEDDILREIFRTGTEPEIRADWLKEEIPRLRNELASFEIAENYHDLEIQAQSKTRQLRDIEQKIAVLEFQMDGIDKALHQQPDISRQELLNLYEGLQSVFKPEALQHFEAVERFNRDLAVKRRVRLEADKNRFRAEMEALEKSRHILGRERDKLLRMLQGKHALGEYTTLMQQLSKLEAEQEKLEEFLGLAEKIDEEIRDIKEQMLKDERHSQEYTQSDPIEKYRKTFVTLAEKLYPHASSGILLKNNTGENQIRYDLAVQIEGDDSDGINAARILCFDWLLLMHGANHNMGFLWHDNRLFADMDPKPRAAWFGHVLEALTGTGKQYIATINTENHAAMQRYLTESQWTHLEKAVKLKLRGDKPKNKLLGLPFGGY